MRVSRRVLVEDRKEKRAVVQCTVLDRVVQLRNSGWVEFLLLDVAEVFKQLFPAFSKEPGLVAAAPADAKWWSS